MRSGLFRTVFARDKRVKAGYFQLATYSYLLGGVVFTTMTNFTAYAVLERMEGMAVPLRIIAMIGEVLFSAFLLYLGFGFANYNFYVKPMRAIAEAARRVADGDFTVRLDEGVQRDEYAVLAEDFNTMVRELAGMETMRTDFISNVSHELKSPLAVIQSSAMALADRTLGDAAREEHRKAILTATGRLSGLVTDILKLNRLENQEIFPENRTFSLDEQLRRCVVAYADRWEEKELEPDIDLEEVEFTGDEGLLEIVWNNLLSNAVKFSNSGGVLGVSLCQDGELVRVTVRDTGCGMDPETQKRIFEKFYQGDTSHAAQGNGLGLALVKRVLDIVGGEISVTSTPGEGSAFTVTLTAK